MLNDSLKPYPDDDRRDVSPVITHDDGPGVGSADGRGDGMVEYQLMTYREAATALGITVASARRLATRNKGWPRRVCNDGLARVGIPLDRLPPDDIPVVAPDAPSDDTTDPAPDVMGTVEALREHIDTLRDQLAKAESRADTERVRADAAQAEAMKVALDAMRAANERDESRREIEQLQARRWWQRIA
jgi:hypothetical protein